ncbi:MAG: hypothetical protein D3914_07355 [Candidatus Electrothrix sp. LOE2]|nr:hypothetical protein [Candidatus Electrothrix sp. LOE2]
MRQDEIVAELRRCREAHAAKYNYNLDAIYKAFKEAESRSTHPKVSFPPKRIASGQVENKTVDLPVSSPGHGKGD